MSRSNWATVQRARFDGVFSPSFVERSTRSPPSKYAWRFVGVFSPSFVERANLIEQLKDIDVLTGSSPRPSLSGVRNRNDPSPAPGGFDGVFSPSFVERGRQPVGFNRS